MKARRKEQSHNRLAQRREAFAKAQLDTKKGFKQPGSMNPKKG
jgi:hypothetical protein